MLCNINFCMYLIFSRYNTNIIFVSWSRSNRFLSFPFRLSFDFILLDPEYELDISSAVLTPTPPSSETSLSLTIRYKGNTKVNLTKGITHYIVVWRKMTKSIKYKMTKRICQIQRTRDSRNMCKKYQFQNILTYKFNLFPWGIFIADHRTTLFCCHGETRCALLGKWRL